MEKLKNWHDYLQGWFDVTLTSPRDCSLCGDPILDHSDVDIHILDKNFLAHQTCSRKQVN